MNVEQGNSRGGESGRGVSGVIFHSTYGWVGLCSSRAAICGQLPILEDNEVQGGTWTYDILLPLALTGARISCRENEEVVLLS